MNIIGREIEVAVGFGSNLRWIKKITANILPRIEKVVDESSFGNLADAENARITKKWFDGDVDGNLHADVIGYFLTNLYGDVSSSSLGSGAYSHAFSLEQSIEHQKVSIVRKDKDIESAVYEDGVVNTLEISANAGELVKFASNVILSTEDTTSETPVYNTEYDFISRDISIKMADIEAGLSGATAIPVKAVTISFNSNAITDYKTGSYNPDLYNSAFALEVSITKNYGDTTFEDLHKAETYKYMQITIEGEADIGGGAKPKLVLLMNKAQVQSWERAGDNNSLVEENITIKSFYNVTDTEASTMTLQNKTADYVIGS